MKVYIVKIDSDLVEKDDLYESIERHLHFYDIYGINVEIMEISNTV